MIQRDYICCNMSTPVVVKDYDQLEDSHTTHLSSYSSSSIFMKQVYYKKGELCSLLPILVGTNVL